MARRGTVKTSVNKQQEKVPTTIPEERSEAKEVTCEKNYESIQSIVEQYERHTLQACRSYAKAVDLVMGKIAVGSPVNQLQIQQIEAVGKLCTDLAYLLSQFKFKSPNWDDVVKQKVDVPVTEIKDQATEE